MRDTTAHADSAPPSLNLKTRASFSFAVPSFCSRDFLKESLRPAISRPKPQVTSQIETACNHTYVLRSYTSRECHLGKCSKLMPSILLHHPATTRISLHSLLPHFPSNSLGLLVSPHARVDSGQQNVISTITRLYLR